VRDGVLTCRDRIRLAALGYCLPGALAFSTRGDDCASDAKGGPGLDGRTD